MSDIKFDLNKTYTWKPDEDITMSGKEFHVIFNNLLSFVNNPIVQQVLQLADAHIEATRVLARLVEQGTIKEYVPESTVPEETTA